MKGPFLAALLGALALAACASPGPLEPPVSPDELVSEIRAGCPVDVKTDGLEGRLAGEGIDGPAPRAEALPDALAVLARSFAKYPPATCECAGLRELVLVSDLRKNGRQLDGLARRREGMVVVDVTEDPQANARYVEHALHHELFHLIDFRETRDLVVDPEWSVVNGPGFGYGFEEGGAPQQGFLSEYSARTSEEDKAELFAYLFEQLAKTRARALEDPVLAKKLEILESRLARSCPNTLYLGPHVGK